MLTKGLIVGATPETIRSAIVASRDHWVENSRAKTPSDVKIESQYCSLCTLFLDGDCVGCPLLTSGNRCFDDAYTDPYSWAYSAKWYWLYNPTDPAAEVAFRRAAQNMVDVLEGLLK